MPDTKVTVAIPTYNRSKLLKVCLESVLTQDYSNFQVVVLDNASSDDTESVVRLFHDQRVTYLRNEINMGMAYNENRAIEVNTSPYLNIFFDDDVMLPDFISKSAKLLDESPHVGFTLTLARYIDNNGSPLHLADVDLPIGVIDGLKYLHLSLTGRRGGPLSTVLMRASAIRAVGSIDSPHTKHTTDLNLYLRLARLFDVGFIQEELVQVRLHKDQASEIEWSSDRPGYIAEYIDALSYLLQSSRAQEASYRNWLAERLRSLNASQSQLIFGQKPNLYWTWMERLKMAQRDLLALIPKGASFILVDENTWGSEISLGHHTFPFLEKNGQYWGSPLDDKTAIQELDRLRQSGAKFIVFGWPAFWWFDCYQGFYEYLRMKFRCVLKNSRLVVFDLRP